MDAEGKSQQRELKSKDVIRILRRHNNNFIQSEIPLKGTERRSSLLRHILPTTSKAS